MPNPWFVLFDFFFAGGSPWGPLRRLSFLVLFVFSKFFLKQHLPSKKKSTKSGVTKVDHWGGVTILYIYVYIYMHNHIDVFVQNIGA